MHPYVHIPAAGLGVLLWLAAFVVGYRVWKKKPKNANPWIAPGLLTIGGGVLAFGGIGTIQWPTYGLFMGTGCLFVLGLTTWWAHRRRLLTPEQVVELCLISGLCGLVGARATHLIEEMDSYRDRSPGMPSPGLLAPLASGDELVLQTHAGEARVAFDGSETTLEQVEARIDQAGAGADLFAKIKTTQHRGVDGIVRTERGFVLKTGRTGPDAQVKVLSGNAAAKLGLVVGSYTKGISVPLFVVIDLRQGGLTYFGSVFGVLLSSFIYLRRRKVSYLRVLDVVAPTLPLGLFFGRLGCFSRGCCWGREAGDGALIATEFPQWSPPWIQFARERLPCTIDKELLVDKTLTPEMQAQLGDVLQQTPALHATQLYEGIAVFLVFWLILAYRTWLQKRIGQTFLLLVLLQAPIRFTVEHFRRDHEVFFTGLGYALTESQAVALAMGVIALPALVWVSLKGRAVPPLPPPDVPVPGQAEQADQAEQESVETEQKIEHEHEREHEEEVE